MSVLPASLLELSLDLLAVFEADGTFAQVNHRWSALGWDAQDLVGHHYSEFVHPDDVGATSQTESRSFAEGLPAHGFVNRYRTATGAYRWLLWESGGLPDGRWLGAARDITVERQALEERAALTRVATQIAEGATPERVFATVAEEVGRLIGADAAGVNKTLDETHVEVVGLWLRDQRTPAFRQGEVVELEGTVLERYREGGLTRFDEVEPERDTEPRLRRYGSALVVPFAVDGAYWGALTAFHASPSGLPDDAVARLREFAKLTALAIGNAEARRALERRALTDSLTSLLNHRAFHDRLAAEVARTRRHAGRLALVVLDIDDFKAMNDTRGHATGDRLLRDLAAALLADRRLGDVAGRIGGDEIAIALPDSGEAGAVALIERLRADLAAAWPGVTFSAGICELGPDDTVEDVMRRADVLLYESKRAGRGRITTTRGRS